MFVQMVNNTTSQGVNISKVAGDDDNTRINRIRQSSNVDIIKESDKNHVQKNVTKKLHAQT